MVGDSRCTSFLAISIVAILAAASARGQQVTTFDCGTTEECDVIQCVHETPPNCDPIASMRIPTELPYGGEFWVNTGRCFGYLKCKYNDRIDLEAVVGESMTFFMHLGPDDTDECVPLVDIEHDIEELCDVGCFPQHQAKKDCVTTTSSIFGELVGSNSASGCAFLYEGVAHAAGEITWQLGLDDTCGVNDDPPCTLTAKVHVRCFADRLSVDPPTTCPGGEATFTAPTCVYWNIVSGAELVTASEELADATECDSCSGGGGARRFRIYTGESKGTVTVRATSCVYDCFEDISVEVGACASCARGCDSGVVQPGLKNGPDVRLPLGRAVDGRSLGFLRLNSDVFSDELTSVHAWQLNAATESVELIRDVNTGFFRQIVTPDLLVDIQGGKRVGRVPVTIGIYDAPSGGWPDADERVNDTGMHVFGTDCYTKILPVSSPRATYVFAYDDEDPDHPTLTIEQSGSSLQDRTYRYTYSSSSSDEWSLALATLDGTAATLRTETESWTDATVSGIPTRTREYSDELASSVGNGLNESTTEVYRDFSWGTVLSQHTVHAAATPSTAHDFTTTFVYHGQSGPDSGALQTAVWKQINSDGSWAIHRYDGGRLRGIIRPWMDSPSTDDVAADSSGTIDVGTGQSTEYEYDEGNDSARPNTITSRVGSIVTSKEILAYTYFQFPSPYNTIDDPDKLHTRTSMQCPDATCATGLTTETVFLDDAGHRVNTLSYADGRLDTHAYDVGTLSVNTASTPITYTFTPGSSGQFEREKITHGTASSPDGANKKTTQDVVIRDRAGRVLVSAMYIRNSSAFSLATLTINVMDGAGHPQYAYHNDGSYEAFSWGCCTETWRESSTGARTEFLYDGLQRRTTSTLKGTHSSPPVSSDIADQISTIALDLSGGTRLVTTTSTTDPSSTTLTTTQEQDLVGRALSTTDVTGAQTTYDEAVDGGIVRSIVHPDGGTEITEYYADGRMRSTHGTAVVSRAYVYGANSDGTTYTRVGTGTADPSEVSSCVRYTMTTTNWLGQTIAEERPAGDGGDPVVTESTYNSSGQLASVVTMQGTTALRAPTVYEYDADTELLLRSGLDLNGTAGLQAASTDRYTETISEFVNDVDGGSGAWWSQQTTKAYEANGSSVATITGINRQRLNNPSTSATPPIEISRSESEDVARNVTRVTSELTRSSQSVTQRSALPFTDLDDQTSVTQHGLLTSTTGHSGVTTTFAYDPHGRRTHVHDPRHGSGNDTVTAYDSNGRVSTVTDPAGKVTTYGYYGTSGPNAGRLKSVENDDGKFTYMSYSPRGELVRTWGHVPQPVEYGYNDLGERTTMTTWQTLPASNSIWTASTWPSSPGTGNVTTWNLDPATGLLMNKIYGTLSAWNSGAGPAKSTDYTYTPDGQIATRVWARAVSVANTNRITTTYSYDEDTGELLNISYNDDPDNGGSLPVITPPVTFTYDRLGRIATVADATGTRTMSYESHSSGTPMTLGPIAEDLDSDFFGSGRDIIREYEGVNSVTGRAPLKGMPVGLQIAPASGGSSIYETAWFHESAKGRLNRVTGPGLPTGGTEPGAKYYFVPADPEETTVSDLVSKIEYRASGSPLLTTTRSFETNRDLVSSIANSWDSNNISTYAYTNNDIGLRTAITRSGAAFSASQSDAWGYSDRNELTSQTRSTGSDAEKSAAKRLYHYDAIGNRTPGLEESEAGQSRYQWVPDELGDYEDTISTSYVSNSLNQYDGVRQRATAPDQPQLAENLSYDDDGNLIKSISFGDANCDNNLDNFDIDPFVFGIVNRTDTTAPAGYLLLATQSCWDQRNRWGDLDGDGNLTNFDIDPFVSLLVNGTASSVFRKYTWDAENRLIATEPSIPPVDGYTKLEFAYDYMGRRVEKRVYVYNSGWPSTPDVDRKYLYDGWNMIAEFDAKTLTDGKPTLVRRYTWGLDLSGQGGNPSVAGIHGAGGIGGLLAVDIATADPDTTETGAFAYAYDANGNVGQMVALASDYGGASGDGWHANRIVATYEYDPYGNVVGPDTNGNGRFDPNPGADPDQAGILANSNAFAFSTKQFDGETGLHQYGYRYYAVLSGRFISADPASESGSITQRIISGWIDSNEIVPAEYPGAANLFDYARNNPTNSSDLLGLNLYAIDGTWGKWGQGTNTEWIYRLTNEEKYYWNGPRDGPSGLDSDAIARSVYGQICDDFRKSITESNFSSGNFDGCGPTVNIVGWSRGAAIAIWVAHKLDRQGCRVCGDRLIYPEINWLGLFDAVDRSPVIPDWAMTNPRNVGTLSHAVKTTTDATQNNMFPTVPVGPWTFFWRKDGTTTTHGDIGADLVNNNAFFWMRNQAKAAGVNIR